MTSSSPFDAPDLPVDDADELAGCVDLFDALSADELTLALVELAYRQHGDVDEATVRDAATRAVEWAVERYYLVAYEPGAEDAGDHVRDERDPVGADSDPPKTDERLLTVGPVAFPTLPAEAEDLPHILDYDTRTVSRESLARAVETRLRGDAARAVVAEDDDRIQHLFDVTYDLEAWAPVDVAEVRERLEAARAASESSDADSG